MKNEVTTTYQESVENITYVLHATDLIRSGDLYLGEFNDGTVMTLAPTIDIKVKCPLLVVKNNEGELKFYTLLLNSKLAVLRRTRSEGLVDITPLIFEWLKELYDSGMSDLKPIALGIVGGRFTHTPNGIISFGVGVTRLFIFRPFENNPDRHYDFEIESKGTIIGVESSHALKREVGITTESIETVCYALIPRVTALISFVKHTSENAEVYSD